MFLSNEERTETILACRFCPMCHVADRLASLVRRESYMPRGRAMIIYALDQGLLKMDETVADIMYTSLNDGLLQEWCVGNYDYEELVIDTRSKIFQQGLAPKSIHQFTDALAGDPSGGPSAQDILSKAGVTTEPDAEVLFFCGCSARDAEKSTIIRMGKLLNQAGVKFQVLAEEPCCGWPLYQLGDFARAREFSIQVANSIRASGASTVVVLDGDCYRMLLTRNSRFGGDLKGIKLVHATALLADLLQEKRIKVAKKLSDPVTYHDPCALARYCEETESPRKILAAILQGELKEMPTSKKLTNCCGAGGMLAVHRPDLSNKVALLRLAEAQETGASILAAGCTRCVSTLSRAAQTGEAESGIRVLSLIDLVAAAAGLEKA